MQKRMGMPKRNLLVGGALVLLVLLLSLSPLLINLARRPVMRVMERVAMASSQETWLRAQGSPTVEKVTGSWILPSYNGTPRVRKPPLFVWLNMLAWTGLSTADTPPTVLIQRARLVSGCMALLLLAGVFCTGRILKDNQTGLIAAMATATIWFVQREARTAAYDIHMVAWVALAMAAALWAMSSRPDDRTATKVAGWLLGGVFLGAAWMTKGPLALAVTLLPLSVIILVNPVQRKRNMVGLLALSAIAAAISIPWYVYAQQQAPRAYKVMVREYAAKRDEFQPPYYYLGLLGLVLPWTWWMIYGVVSPFVRKERKSREWLVPFLWFVVVFVFFSIPGAKQQRYILPIIPAVALLVAYGVRSAAREHDSAGGGGRFLAVILHLHWASLLVVSLLVGPLLAGYDWLCARGITKPDEMGVIPAAPAIGLTVCLTVLVWLGWRWQRKGLATRGAIVTAVWMAIVSTTLWHSYRRDQTWEYITAVQQVSDEIGDHPLHYLDTGKKDRWLEGHCDGMMFYVRRIIQPVRPEEMGGGETGRWMYVLTFQGDMHTAFMSDQGFEAVLSFRAEGRYPVTLWRRGNALSG